jgi:hypothetical protein
MRKNQISDHLRPAFFTLLLKDALVFDCQSFKLIRLHE